MWYGPPTRASRGNIVNKIKQTDEERCALKCTERKKAGQQPNVDEMETRDESSAQMVTGRESSVGVRRNIVYRRVIDWRRPRTEVVRMGAEYIGRRRKLGRRVIAIDLVAVAMQRGMLAGRKAVGLHARQCKRRNLVVAVRWSTGGKVIFESSRYPPQALKSTNCEKSGEYVFSPCCRTWTSGTGFSSHGCAGHCAWGA